MKLNPLRIIRRATAVATVALGCTLLAACGSSESGGEDALKVGISPISVYAAGYQIPGCLADDGYALKLPEFAATPDRLAALSNGSIDMAFGGFTDTIKLNAQGSDLVAVSNAATGGYQLVTSKSSGLSTIADLKGQKIAVPKGTIQELTLRYSMDKAGLDAENEADLIQMDYATMPIALQRGDIDAFVGTAPYPEIAIAQGGKAIPWPDLPWGRLNSGVITTRDFLKENEDAVKSVVGCLQESTESLNKNPEELKDLFVTRFKVPEAAVDILLEDLTLTTDVDPKQVQGLINSEHELGYIDNKPKLVDVYRDGS